MGKTSQDYLKRGRMKSYLEERMMKKITKSLSRSSSRSMGNSDAVFIRKSECIKGIKNENHIEIK